MGAKTPLLDNWRKQEGGKIKRHAFISYIRKLYLLENYFISNSVVQSLFHAFRWEWGMNKQITTCCFTCKLLSLQITISLHSASTLSLSAFTIWIQSLPKHWQLLPFEGQKVLRGHWGSVVNMEKKEKKTTGLFYPWYSLIVYPLIFYSPLTFSIYPLLSILNGKWSSIWSIKQVEKVKIRVSCTRETTKK